MEEDQFKWVSKRIYNIYVFLINYRYNEILQVLFRLDFVNYIRSQSIKYYNRFCMQKSETKFRPSLVRGQFI